MHFGRLVSYSLTLGLLGLLPLSCASDRYVGSIGPTGNYANRGYGFVVALGQGGLLNRWTIIDPRKVDTFPDQLQPLIRETAIDLNGDGFVHHDELVSQWSPNLRIFNKQDSSTRIEVAIEILGGKNQTADFAAYARHFAKTEFKQDTSPKDWIARRVGPNFPALIAEFKTPATRIAIIDHSKFSAEDGAIRRQIVLVRLSGPKFEASHRKDFEEFLDAIALNPKAARQTTLEQY